MLAVYTTDSLLAKVDQAIRRFLLAWHSLSAKWGLSTRWPPMTGRETHMIALTSEGDTDGFAL